MAILWCGGEDIDFPNGGTPSIHDAFYHDTDYSRCSLTCASLMLSTIFPGGEITSGWLHAYLGRAYGGTTRTLVVGFGKSGTTSGIGIGLNSDKFTIVKYVSGTPTTLATAASAGFTSQAAVDVQLISYGASGTVNVYFGGSLQVTYTGDLSIAGVSGFDCVNGFGAANEGGRGELSQVIVGSTDTRGKTLKTHYPNAAGDSNAYTGTYADIDETTNSDADLIFDDTDGHQAMFGLNNLPTGTFRIEMVKIVARAGKSNDASVGSINLGIKSNSTVNVTDTHAVSTTLSTYERYLSVNPTNSDQPFSMAETDALQLVFETEA